MKKHTGNMSRREFIRKSSVSAAALGAYTVAGPLSAAVPPELNKTRVALVGTGSRGSGTWGESLVRDYGDYLEMVGLCDINSKRVDYARRKIGSQIPTFTDFDEMIRSTRPDTVIVTTVDAYHAKYVTRAMELGCDAISEKPLCTHAEQAQSIIDTCKRTGRRLNVTFNARYGRSSMKAKELLMAGERRLPTPEPESTEAASYLLAYRETGEQGAALLGGVALAEVDALSGDRVTDDFVVRWAVVVVDAKEVLILLVDTGEAEGIGVIGRSCVTLQ